MARCSGNMRSDSVCLYWGESGPTVASVFGQDLLRALRLPYVLYHDGGPTARDSASRFRTYFSARVSERVSIARSHDCRLCRFLHCFGKAILETQGAIYTRSLAANLSGVACEKRRKQRLRIAQVWSQ